MIVKAVVFFQSLLKGSHRIRQHQCNMKPRPYAVLLCLCMLYFVYKMTNIQHERTEMETLARPFDSIKDSDVTTIGFLPHAIVHANSDMELKPLWSTRNTNVKDDEQVTRNLLAMAVGIKQKTNVNTIVRKFSSHNFTIILFHYDGNVNGWHDFEWSSSVIHIVAQNQTKWWFAKRFLHPDVVSIYEYIFLWDEDLEVEYFNPGRYLDIVKSEGLEISQPALDPNLSEVHHRITARRKRGKVHRRVSGSRGDSKCSGGSHEPPCAGWVEGMAPVFSKSAWHCVWHLIQNDLIHGWGLDMKLGYCAQGDRLKKVGIIDSEYIIHKGVQTLGGSSSQTTGGQLNKSTRKNNLRNSLQGRGGRGLDARVEVRRKARSELETFQKRWDTAIEEDQQWVDPFDRHKRYRKH